MYVKFTVNSNKPFMYRKYLFYKFNLVRWVRREMNYIVRRMNVEKKMFETINDNRTVSVDNYEA